MLPPNCPGRCLSSDHLLTICMGHVAGVAIVLSTCMTHPLMHHFAFLSLVLFTTGACVPFRNVTVSTLLACVAETS